MILKYIDLLNPWYQDPKHRFDVVPRNLYLDALLVENRLIKVLIGARRVGKTFLLRALINKLLDSGVNPKQIIYLTAEQKEIRDKGIRETLEEVVKVNGLNFSQELHVFIDEIQEVKGWQTDLKFFYDISALKFYVTGSSSLILEKETSKLTGRFVMTRVLPLNFREFLEFVDKPGRSLQASFDAYLNTGGYPQYILTGDRSYLSQSIEATMYRDLLSRYGIRNPSILRDLLYYLADKITTTVSVKNIQKDLKVDDDTARYYLKYLESVYLIYPLYRFGRSNRITKSSNPKYYFNDTGVLSLYGANQRLGHKLENAVFLHLLGQSGVSIDAPRIYYDILDGQEIDFIVNSRLIEVKTADKIDEDVLEQLDLLEREIEVVYFGEIDASYKNFSSNIKFISVTELM